MSLIEQQVEALADIGSRSSASCGVEVAGVEGFTEPVGGLAGDRRGVLVAQPGGDELRVP